MVFPRTLCIATEEGGRIGCVQRIGAQCRRALGWHPLPSLLSRPFGFSPSHDRACGAVRSGFLCFFPGSSLPVPWRCSPTCRAT